MGRERLVLINLSVPWCHSCQSGAVARDELWAEDAGRGVQLERRGLEEPAKVRWVEERTLIQIEGGQRSGQGERSKWRGGKCSFTLPRMTD